MIGGADAKEATVSVNSLGYVMVGEAGVVAALLAMRDGIDYS
jgi:hypothetical protein